VLDMPRLRLFTLRLECLAKSGGLGHGEAMQGTVPDEKHDKIEGESLS
jgi:hypothetical protein